MYNNKIISLWAHIHNDAETYYRINGCKNILDFIGVFLFYHQIWALIVYRIGHVIKNRFLYNLYVFLLWNPIRIITSIEIRPQATIGMNFFIAHAGEILIAPKVVIGNDCFISGRCTLGVKFNDSSKGAPAISDGVKIGIGAVMVGDIKIGRNSIIGANAVVTKSVPDNVVVVGNPARVIKKIGERRGLRDLKA